MAEIKAPQLNKAFTADPDLTLMENLVQQNIPVASSCGGDGICGKCIMNVKGSPLSPMDDLEKRTLEKAEAQAEPQASAEDTPPQLKN